MSVFSENLSSYIVKKDVSISQMAVFCGVNRSSMYKIVQGTRKPASEEFVRQICAFLKLSPEESDQLLEQYQILLMGEKEYRRRKSVQEFLRCCFDSPGAQAPASYWKVPSSVSEGSECTTVLHGSGNILDAFGYITQEEIAKGKGLLRVRMQPAPTFIDMLKTVIDSMDSDNGLQIRHILALNGNSLPEEDSTYNLDLINSILPAAREFSNYELYCYHTNLHNGRVTFSFLPYIIIFSEYVLQVSQDLKYGILLRNKETVAFCSDIFDGMQSACIPMTLHIRDYRDLLYYGKRRNPGSSPISFQMYPNMFFFLTKDLLEKYLRKDLPGRNFVLRSALDITKDNLSLIESAPATILVSERGLRTFLETGMLNEYPSSLYNPPSPEDRLRIMRRYLELINKNNIIFRVVRESFANTSSRTSIWIEDNVAYVLLRDVRGGLKYLLLRDPIILDAFRDYFRSMNGSMCLGAEESLRILLSLVEEAEQKLPDGK